VATDTLGTQTSDRSYEGGRTLETLEWLSRRRGKRSRWVETGK
jgi:hypothetical protein